MFPCARDLFWTSRCLFSTRRISTQNGIAAPRFDPYAYTSGGWLKDNKAHHNARYVKFDFDALCKKAISACPGAKEIVHSEKKEGSFNRAFLLHMDNDVKVVARIPFPLGGPKRLSTHSEVATMEYLRSHATIPAPQVLEWSDDETNSVGTEYIIMEHAAGVPLSTKWDSMNVVEHMEIIKALLKMMQKMIQLTFPAYGSIYFANAPVDPKAKIHLSEQFCIGPHVGGHVWPCEPESLEIYGTKMSSRGPWTDMESFCRGLVEDGFGRIPASGSHQELGYQASPEDHHNLINSSHEILRILNRTPAIQTLSTPTILHPDLNTRHLFVAEDDPTRITGIIDWQATVIDPILLYQNLAPDLVLPSWYPGDPPDFVEGEGEDPKVKLVLQDAYYCEHAWRFGRAAYAPGLNNVQGLDERLTAIYKYIGSSWQHTAPVQRQRLLDISEAWEELGLPDKCPYHPSAEELRKHEQQQDQLVMFRGLLSIVMQAINSSQEGWVPVESLEAARETNRELYGWWIQSRIENPDPEIPIELAKALWPFDLD